MELREFAERILEGETVVAKLVKPTCWTDDHPGPPKRVAAPARCDGLRFSDHRRGARMPHLQGLAEVRLRGVAHHILANHELQALEVMAAVLLAFPDLDPAFRRQLAAIMVEEQRHTRMHLARLAQLGVAFGSLPVNGYVWKRTASLQTPLEYLATLPLTFEGGNLDHSMLFANRFTAVGDGASTAIMKQIYHDEIGHVAFGIEWLRKLKPAGQSDWDAYLANLPWPLHAGSGKGEIFLPEARQAAGLSPDFIAELAAAPRLRDG